VRDGFPDLRELRILQALDPDREHGEKPLGISSARAPSIPAMPGIGRVVARGWARRSSRSERGPSGRTHFIYERTDSGAQLLTSVRKLDRHLTIRLLREPPRQFWPSALELQIMQLLAKARDNEGLCGDQVIKRLSISARRVKDAMRGAHKKGHIVLHRDGTNPREPLAATLCMLTEQGRCVLEIHRAAAVKPPARNARRSTDQRGADAPPTPLEATVLQALWRYPRGGTAREIRAALPSRVHWPSVLAALMHMRRRGWVVSARVGCYKLTRQGIHEYRCLAPHAA